MRAPVKLDMAQQQAIKKFTATNPSSFTVPAGAGTGYVDVPTNFNPTGKTLLVIVPRYIGSIRGVASNVFGLNSTALKVSVTNLGSSQFTVDKERMGIDILYTE